MTTYTRLCSGLLFPVHEKLKHHESTALRRELEKSQWLSKPELESLQVARLRRFLARIRAEVPYYRALFERLGFDVDGASVADLRHLPFLTKAVISQNLEVLKSDRAGPLTRFNTGGSTGEPLIFFQGLERVTHDVAAKWRATRWWDVDIGDREIVLWGSPIELTKQDRIKRIRDFILRTELLPAFQMSDAQMDSYVDRIAAVRPRMLFGYASALALLAQHAEKRGRGMDRLGIKVAFTTGETLYPDQRAVIERVFGAPVANGYGSRDGGFIAHQCPAGGLHLSAEHVIVELVDADGNVVRDGETGEIVVTHLATAEFPFVRYRTGDMAIMSARPCPCGRGLPTLQAVHGRSTDFVVAPDGTRMHALALIYEVRDKPGVRGFKFIQDVDLSIELLVVADGAFDEQAEARVRSGILARMGPQSRFSIRRVDSIPPEKSGKYRYVVSRAAR